MKAFVIEEETVAKKTIVNLLSEIKEIDVVGRCSSDDAAIEEVNRLEPEVLFLDLDVKNSRGFELLEAINYRPRPEVVIVTENDFALQAYDFEAIDFLLKPYEDKRFYRTIRKILATRNPEIHKNRVNLMNGLGPASPSYQETTTPSVIPVRQGNVTLLIETVRINYVLASGSYSEIFTQDKKYVVREPLSKIMNLFEDHDPFFRIHRSAIVNIFFVQELVHSTFSEIDVRMKDKRRIRVSKTQKKRFLRKLGID